MREVVLRVPAAAVEDVLDRLLPIVPGGVREYPVGRTTSSYGSVAPGLFRLDVIVTEDTLRTVFATSRAA
jgi:hypothetical protein